MKERITVTIDKDLVIKLKKLQEEEHRTLSNLVELLLLKALIYK